MNVAQYIRDFFSILFPGQNRYLAHLENEINTIRHERDALQAKVDRMECIMLPLSSPAGAAYTRSLTKKELPAALTAAIKAPARPSWAQVQAD
jgi:hypothetical protein